MIVFDKTEFALGNIKYGDIGKATVNIVNTSNSAVDLAVISSSCSCTTGLIKNPKLAPNSSTQFIISLNTVKAGRGMNHVKSIQLNYTLDGKQFSQVFRIKLNIV